MKSIYSPCEQRRKNPFGYVATDAPGWDDGCRNLARAIDPKTRMSMRIINYCTWRYMSDYTFVRKDRWVDTVWGMAITLHQIDESATLPDEKTARAAAIRLIEETVIGWYVAGFVVDYSGCALKLLLGRVHDHEDLEAPCKLYAVAEMPHPERGEIHLRFESSHRYAPNTKGPLFRDLHMTAASPDGDLRVREYFHPKSGTAGRYDVKDVLFTIEDGHYVPTIRHYRDVTARPVLTAEDYF